MKKIYLAVITFVLAFSCAGCAKKNTETEEVTNRLTFAQQEYQIHSGESVTVKQKLSGISYSFAGEVPENVRLDSTNGTIYFDESVPNHTQVLLVASCDDKQSDPAIVTLLQNTVTTELYFHTPIKNIIDGDYILVSSTNNTSITYALKNDVTGVSIDSMSGRVSYTSAAVEGATFTVVASSADKSIEEDYKVTVSNLAVAQTKSQTIEIGSSIPATYILDFSQTPAGTEESVLAVMNGTKKAKDTEFTYNASTHALVVAPSFLTSFKTGENKIKIITSRNIITADLVMATKFIRNAHDLQSINDDRESLGGYYVLENDIDLTDYLSQGGEGYNDNRGWNQIGIYHDLEADPTRDSFTGTFDGNGHTISGYFENRADDLAHNEGLFGYVTNQGLIKNVGFVGAAKKTTGRNFIGGFVGFNEGTIRNCWSNVNISNKHEDKLFHSIGAFAGANTGIIDGCYTLGLPEGDTLVGAFVGKNYGEISNCFALNATNPNFFATQITGSTTNCEVFIDTDSMNAFDYPSCFDENIWNFPSNSVPTLKNNTTIDFVNGIEITNKEKEVTQGDVVEIDVVIHPNTLQTTYESQVVYTVGDIASTGIVQTGNKFNTSAATVDSFIVTASIHTEFGDFAASHEFKINDKVDLIEFDPADTWPTYVEPGKQYGVKVKVTPANANPEITWEVMGSIHGGPPCYAFFDGNILTIKEEMMNYHTSEEHPTFDIKGTAKNGMALTKSLSLTRIHYLGTKWTTTLGSEEITTGCLNFFKDTTANYIEFKLPHNADLTNFKVFKYSKQISVTKSGYSIRVPISHIKELPNRQIPFTFRCGSGISEMIFRGYACYIDHNEYTISDVPTTYIPLSSKEDFYTYFRMKLDDNHPEKYANYDKTFVLTNDIDFEGAENLVSIGYESSTYPEAKAFSGKIYGFGHKITNATFHYGERSFYAPPTDPSKLNRDPNTNNVGFFGFFRGEVYDVIFENVQSLSYNYGGLFAGRILAGVLENVIMTNCKSMCTYTECDFTIDDLYTGRVAGMSAGRFTGVTYNGTAIGLIGK